MKVTLKMASAIAAVGLSAAAAQAQDCKPAHEFKTLEEGVLNVVAYSLPPFTIQPADGGIEGIEGDLVKRFAEAECLELKVTFADAAANIQCVVTGRADIAVGDWWRTAARAEVVNLSSPTFVDTGGIISKEPVAAFDDLVGKKVGSVQGYLWVDELKALYGDNFTAYPDAVAAAQDLEAGRIDAVVDGYTTSLYAQETVGAFKDMSIVSLPKDERVQSSLEAPQAAVVYGLDNKELGVALDAQIAAFHESGVLVELLKKYSLDPVVAEVGEPHLVK